MSEVPEEVCSECGEVHSAGPPLRTFCTIKWIGGKVELITLEDFEGDVEQFQHYVEKRKSRCTDPVLGEVILDGHIFTSWNNIGPMKSAMHEMREVFNQGLMTINGRSREKGLS
jgi:hypothetical protein